MTVGAGLPRVMIHCMLARHEVLLPLAHALGGAVTLFDLPGHGQSVNWDGTTPYQPQVVDIAASCCDGPTHVIGHSFGATVALRLAAEHPELVSRLTLIEPVYFAAAKGTDAHAAHIRAFRPFIAAMLRGDEAHAAEIFNSLWGETAWQAMSSEQRAYLTERIHLIVATAADIEEDAGGITAPDRLRALDVPVTLIRGETTQPVIGTIHERLVERLPRAKDHVIAGAGHMIPIRKSFVPQVAEIIRAAETGTG